MTLQDQIKNEIKQAMLAKEPVKLSVVRGLTAAFVNEAIAKGVPALVDEDALAVIKRAVKQRKDSIEQFGKGGRADLVASESAELKILEAYLPATMSKDDIRKIATKKLADMSIAGGVGGPADKAKMGQFMGALMKDLKGKADGADVKEVVTSLFT